MFSEAFLARDVDALVALYVDDAVNHQVPEEPLHGKAEIRRGFERFFAAFPDERTDAVAFYEDGVGYVGMARRAAREARRGPRMRLLSRAGGKDRPAARLLGQAYLPPRPRSRAGRSAVDALLVMAGVVDGLAARKADASCREPFIRNCDVPEDFI